MVHSATRPEKADYDEAFVKSQGDFKSKKEYEKAVRAELEAQAKEKNIENQKIDLWDQVIAKSKVKKYPQEEVDLYMETNRLGPLIVLPSRTGRRRIFGREVDAQLCNCSDPIAIHTCHKESI